MQKSLETSLSPLLYPYKLSNNSFITVVTDIFRATTSIVSALDFGIETILPVKGVDEAKKMKSAGYLVACERDGKVLDFADIGNSPSDFWQPHLKGKTLAFSTTNGTQAVNLAKEDALEVLIGAFINLQATAEVLISRNENVIVLCAAWKNLFNLEDTLYAGALAEILLENNFVTHCDATKAALQLWLEARKDLKKYLSNASHRQRLRHIMSQEDFEYSIRLNTCHIVPVLRDSKLIKM
ncbi:MAG: 2-phosphosulfolactate phosphatase [Cyclobacteriaceae bacterium]